MSGAPMTANESRAALIRAMDEDETMSDAVCMALDDLDSAAFVVTTDVEFADGWNARRVETEILRRSAR